MLSSILAFGCAVHSLTWLWALQTKRVTLAWLDRGLSDLLFFVGVFFCVGGAFLLGAQRRKGADVAHSDITLLVVNFLFWIGVCVAVFSYMEWLLLKEAIAAVKARHDIDGKALRQFCWSHWIDSKALVRLERMHGGNRSALGDDVPATFTAWVEQWLERDARSREPLRRADEDRQFFARLAKW